MGHLVRELTSLDQKHIERGNLLHVGNCIIRKSRSVMLENHKKNRSQ